MNLKTDVLLVVDYLVGASQVVGEPLGLQGDT